MSQETTEQDQRPERSKVTRRKFLKRSAAAALLGVFGKETSRIINLQPPRFFTDTLSSIALKLGLVKEQSGIKNDTLVSIADFLEKCQNEINPLEIKYNRASIEPDLLKIAEELIQLPSFNKKNLILTIIPTDQSIGLQQQISWDSYDQLNDMQRQQFAVIGISATRYNFSESSPTPPLNVHNELIMKSLLKEYYFAKYGLVLDLNNLALDLRALQDIIVDGQRVRVGFNINLVQDSRIGVKNNILGTDSQIPATVCAYFYIDLETGQFTCDSYSLSKTVNSYDLWLLLCQQASVSGFQFNNIGQSLLDVHHYSRPILPSTAPSEPQIQQASFVKELHQHQTDDPQLAATYDWWQNVINDASTQKQLIQKIGRKDGSGIIAIDLSSCPHSLFSGGQLLKQRFNYSRVDPDGKCRVADRNLSFSPSEASGLGNTVSDEYRLSIDLNNETNSRLKEKIMAWLSNCAITVNDQEYGLDNLVNQSLLTIDRVSKGETISQFGPGTESLSVKNTWILNVVAQLPTGDFKLSLLLTRKSEPGIQSYWADFFLPQDQLGSKWVGPSFYKRSFNDERDKKWTDAGLQRELDTEMIICEIFKELITTLAQAKS